MQQDQHSIGLRILAVDDVEDNLWVVAYLLRRNGHEVRTATTGTEALEIAETFVPEVVILDVHLPDMNGHDVLKALKQKPWGPGARFVAVTGDESAGMNEQVTFDRYLFKPVTPEQLGSILEE